MNSVVMTYEDHSVEGFLNWKGSVFPSDARTGSQLRKGGTAVHGSPRGAQ